MPKSPSDRNARNRARKREQASRDLTNFDTWLRRAYGRIVKRCKGWNGKSSSLKGTWLGMRYLSWHAFQRRMHQRPRREAWQACMKAFAITGNPLDRPSIDRRDPAKPYAFRNIDVLPMAVNIAKDSAHRRASK